jgi:two-component system heavy metal sensor histidine kinase CusS
VKARRWSLARRLTLGLAGITLLLTLAVSTLSSWFLRQAVARSVDALTLEELDELDARLADGEKTPANFAAIVRDFEVRHSDARLAWRVWDDTGSIWSEYGDQALLAAFDGIGLPGHRQIVTLGPGLRASTSASLPGLRIGLVVDASEQIRLLHRYQAWMFAMAAIGALAALCVGGLFSRKVSRWLGDVAEQARSVHGTADSTSVAVSGAPEEIRDVADAFMTMLTRIRQHSDRSRLMTAGMAHELRSPLQNLLGETEVTLMRPRDAAEYRRVLESHHEELASLGRVVDNLVLLCSPGGSSSTPCERFDLAREARLRLGREQQEAQRHGVRLELESRGDTLVSGDREALLLALRNVVANAIQWTPSGGTVAVELTGEQSVVRLTVDDAGPGIPVADRARIFEPFHRGTQRNGRRVGYGLGLALTRSAVEAHGGSITVDDSALGGARIRIVVPRGGATNGRADDQDPA